MPAFQPTSLKHAKPLCAALALLTLSLLTGCSDGPDLGHDRDQVRTLQRHRANDATRSQSAHLMDDDFRQVRFAIAKSHVTPADAARLPVGAVKLLKTALTNPRYRRYGPSIVRLIGMLGGDAEFEFLRHYLENEISGSIDEFTYRTLLSVPEAIGYIAISNDRAYATLRDYLRLQFWRENIQWRSTASDRELDAYRLVLAALDGIAVSGRREAVPYVQYLMDRQSRETGAGVSRGRTLMDERLEARAEQTIAILTVAD